MSLKLLAKQMEAKGRKGDSMLVHMTPGEVAGLQKLAESAGGSLTVNPETGLVEANFLKRMLPTLVGIGVGIGTGNPFLGAAAGAAVGGVQAKENKQDVGMGMLMGGLGGYGGAGLGAGLTAAGGTAAAAGAAGATTAGAGAAGTAAAAGQQATALTAEEIAKQQIAEQAQQAALAEGAKVSGAEAAQQSMAEQALAKQAAEQTTAEGAQRALDYQARQQIMTGYNPNAAPVEMSMGPKPDLATEYGLNTGTTAQPELTASQRFSQAGEGISQLATKEGRAAFGSEFGMMEAGAGAAPLMAPGKAPGEAPVDDEMYVYDYDVGRTGAERAPSDSSAERTYFEGRYSPMRRVRAKDYGYAEGGIASVAGAPMGMTGASGGAFDYLMGNAPSSAPTLSPTTAPSASQAGLGYLMGQAPTSGFASPVAQPATPAAANANQMYTFDPGTGTFAKNVNYVDAEAAAAAKKAADAKKAQQRRQSRGGRQTGSGGRKAEGGLVGLAQGGMASGGFVVPADVVSALGNGSTDAGLRSLNTMLGGVKPIKGKGDGLSDSIKTSIDGKQPARVADGEAYIDPKTVKRVGGAKKLYAMMDKVRAQAHGKTSQQRKVNPAKVLA